MRGASILGLMAVTLCILTACDNDSTGFLQNPILTQDTIEVAAPLAQNAGLPTALDVSASFGVRGGRFPERARDALEWDFAVRIEDGEIVLVPSEALQVESRAPPAITTPIEGVTFDGLREAPGRSDFVRDSAIVMRVGSLYAARSREFLALNPVLGSLVPCVQYAKLEPLAVDIAAGTLRLKIATNENCGDPRLIAVE